VSSSGRRSARPRCASACSPPLNASVRRGQMDMSDIEHWFRRKTSGRLWKLKAPYRATERWSKFFAGQIHEAGVTLMAQPADSFEFLSKHAWPSSEAQQTYDPYVLDAIV